MVCDIESPFTQYYTNQSSSLSHTIVEHGGITSIRAPQHHENNRAPGIDGLQVPGMDSLQTLDTRRPVVLITSILFCDLRAKPRILVAVCTCWSSTL